MKNPGNRAHPRKKVQIPAVVSDRNFSKPFNCMICDASRSGCRIKSDRLDVIPDEIYVQAEGMRRPIKGKIVWRKISMAGVQFIWDKPAMAGDSPESQLRRTLSAIVSDRYGGRSIGCSVENLNVSGCMAVADDIDALPEEISIKLERINAPFNARIVWRGDGIAGVEFAWKAGNVRGDDALRKDTPDDDIFDLSPDQELSDVSFAPALPERP